MCPTSEAVERAERETGSINSQVKNFDVEVGGTGDCEECKGQRTAVVNLRGNWNFHSQNLSLSDRRRVWR